MSRKKILIGERSSEFSGQLCDLLENDYELHICQNGLDVQRWLWEFLPDVLIMDLSLPGIDGISLLKQINEYFHTGRPRVLLTSCYMSDYLEAMLGGLGVDLLVLKPCKAEFLVARIREMTGEEENANAIQFRSQSSVASILMELNIPARRRGFTYLENAIRLHAEKPAHILTKDIYPEVGREFDTNSQAVERGIREMIRNAWEGRDDQVWQKYFHPGKSGMVPRPTNAEFICTIAECYRVGWEEWA